MKKIFIIVLSILLSACSNSDQPSRTLGSVIDDNLIELKLNRAIASNAELRENVHVDVVSYNGILLVAGEAKDRVVRDKVVKIATNLPRVRKVFNQINVVGLDKQIIHAVNPQDMWITTKVKAQMLTNAKIAPNKVKVVTEDGVVYLLGLVGIKDADNASHIASNVTGVKKVVKLFEYVG